MSGKAWMTRKKPGIAGAAIIASMLGLAFEAPPSAIADTCVPGAPCDVKSGFYIAKPPEDWDGKRPLPMALFFHGWQGSAEATAGNRSLTERFSDMGVLLVVPHGEGKTWSFPGSPSKNRDEVKFVRSVLDDVFARYPIDREHVWATGFSLGGSMVWTLACRMGAPFTAFVPVAGAFWDPIPDGCPAGPQNIRHIHGLSDKTVPLEGRYIRTIYKQSDVFDSFDRMKEVNECGPQPTAFREEGHLLCRTWDQCASGAVLEMCLHNGGHSIRSEWMNGAWSFVRNGKETAQPD
ncbi:MAG: polyhydroxybutyrate depolymerase [Pseudomonadota bacterium]